MPGQYDVCIDIGSSKKGLKSPLVVLPCLTMQVLVEDVMYVSQGGIPMSTERELRSSGDRGVRSYLTF